MKKIMMVCEAFGGGVFTYVAQLCNDMCDKFDITLVYHVRPQTPDDYRKFLDPRIHLIELKILAAERVKNVFCDYKMIRELRQLEKEIKPDIIHLHSSIAGGIGRLAFKGKSNAVIYTPHGYAHILRGDDLPGKLYGFIEKFLGRASNAITLTCSKSEDEIALKLTDRTAYIETGINIKEISSFLDEANAEKNNTFTVFTVGRACKQKQPHLFNQIALMVPEASFIWIGDGDLRTELTAPNIKVTGWKSREEAISLAKKADVFILCSLGEAIAMSLLENMYLKKLCLVSDVMGNKSVITDNVNGYVCTSAEDYAERIRMAMIEFPTKLTERAFHDVETIYNTDVMKEKYREFYHAVLENRGKSEDAKK